MEYRFVYQFFLLFIFSYSHAVFSLKESIHCDGSVKQPCLVQDTDSNNFHVKSLRDLSLIFSYYPENTVGIRNLWASASSEPDEQGWQEIAAYINKQSPEKLRYIVVVDLRQESHGYLNGNAITLAAWNNWINLGKSKEQVVNDEQSWLNGLSTHKNIHNVLTVRQFEAKEYSWGRTLKILSINNEEDLVRRQGMHYYRLNVSDHQAPYDNEVDEFINFYHHLPEKTWLHFHCRGGKGRSTTFLTMVDILNNADKVSFQEIIARQAAIPPFYDLTDVIRYNNPELTPLYVARLEFLHNFYNYAQQILSGYKGSWSEYISRV